MADPYLKITFTGSDGTKPEAKVIPEITLTIPAVLSKRIAILHATELLKRALPKKIPEAVAAIGLK